MQKSLINKYFSWGKITLDFYTGIACGIIYDKGYMDKTTYIAIPFFILEIQKTTNGDK